MRDGDLFDGIKADIFALGYTLTVLLVKIIFLIQKTNITLNNMNFSV